MGSPRWERWRMRGTRAVGALEMAGRREVFDALRDGGPTKREGAGRRLEVVFWRGVLFEVAMVYEGGQYWRKKVGG